VNFMRCFRSLRARAALSAAGVASVVAANHFGLSLVIAGVSIGR
jgi:hypothetical protein